LWIGANGKRQRKDFGPDLMSAVDAYSLLKAHKRKDVTLRCKNMTFAPPDKYADREEVIVFRNGKRFKGKKITEPRRYRVRMFALNRRGIWWCPYCQRMRRFVKREGDYPALACPVCGATHRLVSRFNPMAEYVTVRVQDPNRASTQRSQRRRRSRAAQEEDE
jgi:glutaredoxin